MGKPGMGRRREMTRFVWNAFVVALLLVLLLAGISCSNAPIPTPEPRPTQEPTPPPGYFTHTDDMNGFSIAYPGGWMKPLLPPPFDRMVLLSVGPSEPCGGFEADFYVYADRLRASQTLEDYSEYDLGNVERSYREFTKLVKVKPTISGLAAIRVEYEYRLADYTKVREMTIYVEQGSTVWKLDFIAAASCWDQYTATVDTMVSSFKTSQ
jgi:hypothetical protein